MSDYKLNIKFNAFSQYKIKYNAKKSSKTLIILKTSSTTPSDIL